MFLGRWEICRGKGTLFNKLATACESLLSAKIDEGIMCSRNYVIHNERLRKELYVVKSEELEFHLFL